MPTHVDTYTVQDGETVFLTLQIGEGQPGYSTVMIGSEKKASRKVIKDLELGDGADLRGKVLITATTVVDLQQDHDRTSVTIKLTDGHDLSKRKSQKADPSGVVVYLFVITFA